MIAHSFLTRSQREANQVFSPPSIDISTPDSRFRWASRSVETNSSDEVDTTNQRSMFTKGERYQVYGTERVASKRRKGEDTAVPTEALATLVSIVGANSFETPSGG